MLLSSFRSCSKKCSRGVALCRRVPGAALCGRTCSAALCGRLPGAALCGRTCSAALCGRTCNAALCGRIRSIITFGSSARFATIHCEAEGVITREKVSMLVSSEGSSITTHHKNLAHR